MGVFDRVPFPQELHEASGLPSHNNHTSQLTSPRDIWL